MRNTRTVSTLLQSCLDEGILRIGEVEFTHNFRVYHYEDLGRSDLQRYVGPDMAREIARYDDAGNYRPLKTAPNLRHGWELILASIEELHLALDFLYPAALGLWLASLRTGLPAITLRQTLGRQSGMYRVAAKISDDQAEELMHNFCGKKCLRRRQWKLDTSTKASESFRESKIPLLCSEACHLFISEARRIAKSRP